MVPLIAMKVLQQSVDWDPDLDLKLWNAPKLLMLLVKWLLDSLPKFTTFKLTFLGLLFHIQHFGLNLLCLQKRMELLEVWPIQIDVARIQNMKCFQNNKVFHW